MTTKTATSKTPATSRGTKSSSAKKAKPKNPSSAKPTDKPSSKTGKKLSAIDAAAKVLVASKEPMNAKQMIEAMAAQKLWTSPGGKTPHATLYSAILREIQNKGKNARFKKTERGKFAANG